MGQQVIPRSGIPGGGEAAGPARSLNRSCLAHLLRREQIKPQVGLSYALMQTTGASETKAAFEQARLLIQRAEWGAWGASRGPASIVFYPLWRLGLELAAFNSHATLDLARQFLTLAHERDETLPFTRSGIG